MRTVRRELGIEITHNAQEPPVTPQPAVPCRSPSPASPVYFGSDVTLVPAPGHDCRANTRRRRHRRKQASPGRGPPLRSHDRSVPEVCRAVRRRDSGGGSRGPSGPGARLRVPSVAGRFNSCFVERSQFVLQVPRPFGFQKPHPVVPAKAGTQSVISAYGAGMTEQKNRKALLQVPSPPAGEG